jgi:hypothetical protein
VVLLFPVFCFVCLVEMCISWMVSWLPVKQSPVCVGNHPTNLIPFSHWHKVPLTCQTWDSDCGDFGHYSVGDSNLMPQSWKQKLNAALVTRRHNPKASNPFLTSPTTFPFHLFLFYSFLSLSLYRFNQTDNSNPECHLSISQKVNCNC